MQIVDRDSEIAVLVKLLKKRETHRVDDADEKENVNPNKTDNCNTNDHTVPSYDDSEARNDAFLKFREHSELTQVIENNKTAIRGKFEEGKKLGKMVNDTRTKMNKLKSRLQELQVSRAMKQMDLHENSPETLEQEETIRKQIESHKSMYKEHYIALKRLKRMLLALFTSLLCEFYFTSCFWTAEIEHIKANLEKNRKKLQIEFEKWWHQEYIKNHMKIGYKTSPIAKSNLQMKVIHDTINDDIHQFYKIKREILKRESNKTLLRNNFI